MARIQEHRVVAEAVVAARRIDDRALPCAFGDQRLRIGSVASAWTNAFAPGQEIVIPIKSGEGCFVADAHTLDELEVEDRVVARYLGANPNGSMRDIAAIRNEMGNVVGIMPHPEHAVDVLTGPSLHGLGFFTSVVTHLATVPARSAA